jgi:hypothetical protein
MLSTTTREVKAPTLKTAAEMNAERERRGREEMHSYSFRMCEVAGQTAVHVRTPNNPAGYAILGEGRCTCGDSTGRLERMREAGEHVFCKHWWSWIAFLDSYEDAIPTQEFVSAPAPAVEEWRSSTGLTKAQVQANMAVDFPE